MPFKVSGYGNYNERTSEEYGDKVFTEYTYLLWDCKLKQGVPNAMNIPGHFYLAQARKTGEPTLPFAPSGWTADLKQFEPTDPPVPVWMNPSVQLIVLGWRARKTVEVKDPVTNRKVSYHYPLYTKAVNMVSGDPKTTRTYTNWNVYTVFPEYGVDYPIILSAKGFVKPVSWSNAKGYFKNFPIGVKELIIDHAVDNEIQIHRVIHTLLGVEEDLPKGKSKPYWVNLHENWNTPFTVDIPAAVILDADADLFQAVDQHREEVVLDWAAEWSKDNLLKMEAEGQPEAEDDYNQEVEEDDMDSIPF